MALMSRHVSVILFRLLPGQAAIDAGSDTITGVRYGLVQSQYRAPEFMQFRALFKFSESVARTTCELPLRQRIEAV